MKSIIDRPDGIIKRMKTDLWETRRKSKFWTLLYVQKSWHQLKTLWRFFKENIHTTLHFFLKVSGRYRSTRSLHFGYTTSTKTVS